MPEGSFVFPWGCFSPGEVGVPRAAAVPWMWREEVCAGEWEKCPHPVPCPWRAESADRGKGGFSSRWVCAAGSTKEISPGVRVGSPVGLGRDAGREIPGMFPLLE